VWVDHSRQNRFACSTCELELAVYDHATEREWRHLDSGQFLTNLHAKSPRVNCPEHGVLQVRLPWAEPMSRFTTLFERLAVDVLKECDVLGASRLLRTSWGETWHLMQRAVARGSRSKSRAPRRISSRREVSRPGPGLHHRGERPRCPCGGVHRG
jgi:transposase